MEISTGTRLGPYEIVGRVGAGGMGEVYRARDRRLERDVAIKVLPQDLSQNEKALTRFRREAKALAALSHPNILTIHDIGEHEGQVYVVMELLEGQTLRQRTAGPTLSWEKAVEIMTAVIEGLAAAHSRGIIHRDLKPENIFITTDGHLKILDFGLAKRFDSEELQTRSEVETESQATADGTILGTVPYMSPEQARGESLDPQSDIFSAGTVLYELLTGKMPFQGSNIAATMYKIIHETPPLPSTIRADLPKWVDSLSQRSLAKEKKSRYSSAAEMLTDLKKYRDILRTEALGVSNLRTFARRIRKPRVALPSIAAILIIALSGYWFFDRQAKIRWAKEEALPKIERLVEEEWRDFTEPYKLAVEAEKYIPDDPKLAELISKSSFKINVKTEPPGANVYFKEYKKPNSEWEYLGVSPIEAVRVPIGIFRWKLEKEGHETVQAAATTFNIDVAKKDLLVPSDLIRVLDKKGSLPDGMIRVSGSRSAVGDLADFYIDKYEVTNKKYKEFVDAGGYANQEYWKSRFVKDEQTLRWEEAMAAFVDQTGRPGPSTWQAGDYLEGQGDYPVSGISWYEAAAYAEYAGKSLPTADHWGIARGERTPIIMWPQFGGFATFAPFSNFGGKGPVRVGSLPGITSYGAYDMAGNVREWCWNETDKGRLIRGGGWNDITYMFDIFSQAPSMDRSVTNGFRCAFYPDPERVPELAFRQAKASPSTDFYHQEPVPDSVFEVYKERFSYDQTPLNARVESTTESDKGWVQEKITFDAAYGNERIIAHLFLPQNAAPPYQTVIYVPGSGSAFQRSSEDLENYFEFPIMLSFVVKSGRAVLYPVYKGTFERGSNESNLIHLGDDSHRYVEYLIQIVKDFRKCIDYLETRQDIDSNSLAYYGGSWGARIGTIIPAVEDRLKASVLVAGGIRGRPHQPQPPANEVNYVSRVKIPTLMLNGKYDSNFHYETSIKPMFDLLGTPDEQKELKLYETDHIPPKNEVVRETLAWLDRYLGPVQR